MTGLLSLVETSAAGAVTRRSAVPVREILRELEASASPVRVAKQLGLQSGELVAALGVEGLGSVGSEGPGLIPGPIRFAWAEAALGEREWAEFLPASPRPVRLALASGLLQILDVWEASHEAAQQAGDLGERSFSAYWHGVAHRREPDSGNASYWFRRVGRHPLFTQLGDAARRLAAAEGQPEIADRVATGGVWNPFAFIEFCADGRPAREAASLARKLQRLEMALLLDATAGAAGLA